MKINLGLKDAEGVRNALTKLQWCCILWYCSENNSVTITTCSSLKGCLKEVFRELEEDYYWQGREWIRETKRELIQHVIDYNDNPYEYSGCDSVTIDILEDKECWKQTARELDYEC